MSSQHDHFVGLVGSGNFRDRIVGSFTLGVVAVDYVELQRNLSGICQKSRDAAKIFITHDHRRDYFIDVKSAIVESPYLTVFAACVVDAHQSAISFEKLVELFINLPVRQYFWVRRWCRGWGWGRTRIGIETPLYLLVIQTFGRRGQVYLDELMLTR